jgi:hypothetical protein
VAGIPTRLHLLNLPGLADPLDPNRATVDLLFFPTGGGKTEAYLGLAAFAMVLRRLHHPGEKGRAAAGVSVIMRYTLRLLTLDQLARAAGLVCALELEREKNTARYGEWPFEIGLWVGKAATPAEARRRLEAPFHKIEQRVDCAIATNMISVGLDIARLGLMVVVGQPKTHAEYIQATSRVGRADKRPGLIVTLLNIHKPRDRSHYERFRHYHETFYRSVEVASVTPFSARTLDRGFAGALMALARHAEPKLAPPQGVERIAEVRASLELRLLNAFLERVRQQPFSDEAEREERLRSVQNRVVDLLDSWRKIFDDYHAAGVAVQYQKYELSQPKPLLREMLDKDFDSEHHRKFRTNRSLRDVEPEVNLFLKDLSGMPVEDRA